MKSYRLFFRFATFMAAVTLAGCTTMQDVHQNLVKSLRSPGESMVENPEETALFHQCPEGGQYLPVILETETIPNRSKPGEEVNHRIRYVLCLANESEVLHGEIIRRISYKDRTVFSDTTKYDFKAGIWTVDAFVLVSGNAHHGTYTVETTLKYNNGSDKKSNTFEVKKVQEGN